MDARISSVALAALALAASTHAAGPRAFTGTWRDDACPRGAPAPMCGWFELSLAQEGSAVCGTFAAERNGEADAGAVVGVAVGGAAVVTLTSSLRDGSIWIGRLDPTRTGLRWNRSAAVKGADPGRGGIAGGIPAESDLARAATPPRRSPPPPFAPAGACQ